VTEGDSFPSESASLHYSRIHDIDGRVYGGQCASMQREVKAIYVERAREDLRLRFDDIFLKITEIQRLCVSGAVADVWNDSTLRNFSISSSTISWSTSQVFVGLSHLDETSTVGRETFERPPAVMSDISLFK